MITFAVGLTVAILISLLWARGLERQALIVAEPTPTINALPRALAVPTVWRRKHWIRS